MINLVESGGVPLGTVRASLSYEREVGLCIVVLVQGEDYIVPVDLGEVVHNMVDVGCPLYEFYQLQGELETAHRRAAKVIGMTDGL